MNNGKRAKIGMSRETGEQIERAEHISQSIQDILTTPIGSRIQRREYGSYLFELIDTAGNDAGQLRLLAALVDSVARHEPRVVLNHASIDVSTDGRVVLDYEYKDLQSNNAKMSRGQASLT